MRMFTLFAALAIILTGCTSRPVNGAIPSGSARKPAVISRAPEGIYDERLLLSHAFLKGEPNIGENGYRPPYLLRIYRTINPAENADNVFETFLKMIEEGVHNYFDYLNYYAIGDVLVPYLLTEESVNTSDEELLEKLSAITEAYVFSKRDDGVNYRLIAISENPASEYTHWMTWHYFVQVWDDEYIWAQPICEYVEFRFEQATFIEAPDGTELVLLCGFTERPHGTSFAVASVGFAFEDGVWAPMQWEDVYEEVAAVESLMKNSDGIYMIYDPLYADHNGPLYRLELSEDGSFWADYSRYPDWPANEGQLPRELLFRIRG